MNDCYFYAFDRCRALKVLNCENCRFKKTEKQFFDALAKSEARLKQLGLRVSIVKNNNGGESVTTEVIKHVETS